MLFLSYAEQDGETARKIVDWFKARDVDVYFWEEPGQRGGRFIPLIEQWLSEADAFLALVSSNFIDSPWCHRETELAILREVELQRTRRNAKFIRVLKIAEVPHQDTGFLSAYDWFDLTDTGSLEGKLGNVAASLQHVSYVVTPNSHVAPAVPVAPSFRNRDDELGLVLRGITNAAGPHFWLVIAPPQLGKTWFMDQLAVKIREEHPSWSARRVDVRDYQDDIRDDIGWLLSHLFGMNGLPASVGDRALRRIASEILSRGKSHLCLLDSAELLDEETVRKLRAYLGEIYRLVQQGGNADVRVAFIAASRRDDEWRGVTPGQRLSPLPLSEFKIDVVQDALHSLARQMGRMFSSAELREYAALVYRLSEGLPALLALCLQWVQHEQWVAMGQLAEQELFDSLAEKYIQQHLLAPTNLFRWHHQWDTEARFMVESAFRILVPYRLFTQSHLRHYMEDDDGFAALLERAGWSVERLWEAISGTALLSRPLDEPWQAMQAAIRRLLFRYFYKSDDMRAQAHTRARRFAEIWSDGQAGNEQVIGLVECLWHEAAALRYSGAPEIADVLCRSAKTLAESLKPSSLYTEAELRRSAARRMRNNEEFQDTVAHVSGLFDRLVRIVETAEEP